MKVRNSFVTNSSSSSFLVCTKSRDDLKTKITYDIDLYNLCTDDWSDPKEFLNMARDNDYDNDLIIKLLKKIDDGYTIYRISSSDEDDESGSIELYNNEGSEEKILPEFKGEIIKEEYNW